MSNKKTFYKTTWFMWLALILFAPAGIVLLWVYHKQYSKNVKIILSAIFAIFFIIEIIVGNSTDNTIQTANTPETTIIPANETVPEPTSKPDTEPTPEQEQDEKIDVVLDVSVNKNNGKPIFTINTNLPDETDLMLTLKGNKYTGQTHAIVENGVAVSEAFSSKGKAISGKYTLSVSMSEPKFQSNNVRATIGENGENMSGKYVKTSDVNNSKFINGDFDFSLSLPEDVFDFSDYDEVYKDIDISNLKIKYGELLSVVYNDGTVVVKTKIEPSYNNNATIAQNYFNVADLVKNHGFNTCKKLSYWAVADMSDGTEGKCISFDLNKKIIKELYNENIVENKLGEYTTDLWILPSLQN